MREYGLRVGDAERWASINWKHCPILRPCSLTFAPRSFGAAIAASTIALRAAGHTEPLTNPWSSAVVDNRLSNCR